MALKAACFVEVLLLAAGLLLAENPSVRAVVLLMVALWGACRAYHFAFYVLEHYVDQN